MIRGHSKRELAAWTAIGCFVAFGSGAVLVKRLRPVGPMEFQELPPSQVAPTKPPPNVSNPRPERMNRENVQAPVAIPERLPQVQPSSQEATNPGIQSSSAVRTTKQPSKAKAVPELGSVSLNAGSLDELEQLPGVGPSIAQRIVDYRTEHGPFQSLDELRNVKGIGEKRFAKLEPFLKL